MTGRHGPILASLAVGMGIGLILGWVIWSVDYHNARMADLSPAYKDDYIRMISAAYSLDGDAGSAQKRLSSLHLIDPVSFMNDLIARETPAAKGSSSNALLKLAQLVAPSQTAAALSTPTVFAAATTIVLIRSPLDSPTALETATLVPSPNETPIPTATLTPSGTETPSESLRPPDSHAASPIVEATATDLADFTTPPSPSATWAATASRETTLAATTVTSSTATPTAKDTATPTSPLTAIPTQVMSPPTGSIFPLQLLKKDPLSCMNEPGSAYLRFYVRDVHGRDIPNIGITINWPNGEDTVYTGLKPERGIGYADFKALPGTYSVALIDDQSNAVANLTIGDPVSDCSTDAGATIRGWRLVFQEK